MKTIVISGIIGDWGLEARDIRSMLDEANGDDVKVELNSPGGFVDEGLEIYHLFKNYSGHVHFHVMGKAASMASLIPFAGDRITAEEATVWMIHNPMGGVSRADHIEAAKFANYLKNLSILFAKVYSVRTGKSEKEMRKIMDATTFFFGSESKDFGLVDEIIKTDNKVADSREDAVAYAQIEIEDCLSQIKKHKKNENMERIAACFDNIESASASNETENKTSKPTANVVVKTTEVKMNLSELMIAHPELKIEIDSKMVAQYSAGMEAGKKEISAKVEMASKYFDSKYPAKIKEIAAEAILGKKNIETLEAVVAMFDMNAEAASDAAAAIEQPGNTPAQQPSNMAASGVAQTAEDVTALFAADNGGA